MGKVPKLKLQVLKVRNIVIILSKLVNGIKPVSYTHLTLPTIRLV